MTILGCGLIVTGLSDLALLTLAIVIAWCVPMYVGAALLRARRIA